MQYQQTSTPNLERIGTEVARLLRTDLAHVALEYERRGYSGGVHRLRVRDEQGGSDSLIVKKGPVGVNYQFYLDVLAPYRLNSPHMYGVIEGGDGEYLVMQYIPHDPPDWKDPDKYARAVDWLIHRDTRLASELEQIAQLDYVEPFDMGDFSSRTAAIFEASSEDLDALLSDRLVRLLDEHSARFAEAAERVRCGPQTVVHNDFQMLNILFATGRREGELYVVDWTYPGLGSVGIDLATLVHVAPKKLRPGLIDRYLAARPIRNFGPIFEAAQMHVHLSILTWMIDAMRSGHAHAINRSKMRELVDSIERFFAGASEARTR